MKKGLYIALEGVKGTGKTTVFHQLLLAIEQENICFETACPTRKTPKDQNVWEVLFSFFDKDFIKKQVYARRAARVAAETNWAADLIVGDRSLLTSYATRLWYCKNPIEQIAHIEAMQNPMPVPDIVFFLNAPTETILQRLANRKRCYGKTDETPSKIVADQMAYRFLQKMQPSPKLKTIEWIELDASQPVEKTLQLILKKIKHKMHI